MGVPTKYYDFVDGQTPAGKVTAARLNGDFDPLYVCLNPAVGGLEDTNVKAGAKIVCSDRGYTGANKITGAWEFLSFPLVPAASILDASLSANVMLKSVYDTDADGKVNDADKLDGQEAAAFAAASHVHAGADISSGTVDGDRLPAISTTKQGSVPATGTPAGKYLRDDGGWAGAMGYALAFTAGTIDPPDNEIYFFGNQAEAPWTASGAAWRRVYIPKAGVIKTAYISAYAVGAGSAENISVYIRLNDTTDTLIKTVGAATNHRLFDNNALSIAVAQGGYITIKVVCPTWATNPSGVKFSGNVYIE